MEESIIEKLLLEGNVFKRDVVEERLKVHGFNSIAKFELIQSLEKYRPKPSLVITT